MWLYIFWDMWNGDIIIKRRYNDTITTIPKNNFKLHFKTPDMVYDLSLPELILGTKFAKTIDPKIKMSEEKVDVVREAVMEDLQNIKEKIYWSREDFNKHIKELYYDNTEMFKSIISELKLVIKEYENFEKGTIDKKMYWGVSIYRNLKNQDKLPKISKELKEKAEETLKLIDKTIKEILRKRLENKELFEEKIKKTKRKIEIDVEEKWEEVAELVILELFEKYWNKLKVTLIDKEDKKSDRILGKAVWSGILLMNKWSSRYGSFFDVNNYKKIIIKGIKDEVKFEDEKMQKDFNEYLKAKEKFKAIQRFKKLDFHPNTKWWTFRERVEALPDDFETYMLDGAKSLYDYGVTSWTAIDGQVIWEQRLKNIFWYNIIEKLKDAIDNKKEFYEKAELEYDYSVSVEPQPNKENPEYVAIFLNKEYKWTANGYYYIWANEKEFIGVDID